MKVNDEIVRAYLSGEDIENYKDAWFFHSSSVAGDMGRDVFTKENIEKDVRDIIDMMLETFSRTVSKFKPFNQSIWNAFFTDWEEKLENIQVDLIVGFPQPYDATTEYDEAGVCHVIFDLGCWVKYFGHCDLESVINNLLTHEIFHVLIEEVYPQVKSDGAGEDYHLALDALTFNEAFAHLVSYNSKEIEEVDWESAHLCEVREKSAKEMRKALAVTGKTEQIDYLYRAECGEYYEKYACMLGMLYLAEVWRKHGIVGLKECFLQGYKGFVQKCLM